MRLISVCIIAAIYFVHIPLVHAASFDCKKANSYVERTICSDPKLSAMDEQLTAFYKQTLLSSLDKKAVKQSQRAWLREVRNVCESSPCLVAAYENRLAEINSSEFAASSLQQSSNTNNNKVGSVIYPLTIGNYWRWCNVAEKNICTTERVVGYSDLFDAYIIRLEGAVGSPEDLLIAVRHNSIRYLGKYKDGRKSGASYDLLRFPLVSDTSWEEHLDGNVFRKCTYKGQINNDLSNKSQSSGIEAFTSCEMYEKNDDTSQIKEVMGYVAGVGIVMKSFLFPKSKYPRSPSVSELVDYRVGNNTSKIINQKPLSMQGTWFVNDSRNKFQGYMILSHSGSSITGTMETLAGKIPVSGSLSNGTLTLRYTFDKAPVLDQYMKDIEVSRAIVGITAKAVFSVTSQANHYEGTLYPFNVRYHRSNGKLIVKDIFSDGADPNNPPRDIRIIKKE